MSRSFYQEQYTMPLLGEQVIHRNRLELLLKDFSKYKLTLVSSPAGSGKSTLMADFMTHQQIECSWYALDKTDNNFYRFISFFLLGLEKNEEVHVAELKELMEAVQSIGDEVLIRAVLNNLHASKREYTQVFDDYHFIDNPEILHFMSELITHLPTNFHIILLTREDPSLPLSALRVKNQLLEIRINQLKFSDEEAMQFLNDSMKLGLSSESINLLNKRAEGWIAGMQLAALYFRDQQDKDSLAKEFSGSHVYIMDYLLDEVLNKQKPEIQKFLVSTSILNQFCGELCDEILGFERGTSQEIMKSLVSANLFIIPLDHQRHWFRYHHLFRDLLGLKLAQTTPHIPNLHLIASKWYYKNGNTSEAVYHALLGHHIEEAANMLESVWASMDLAMQSREWLQMARQLPSDEIRKRPVLNVAYAWALIDAGELDLAVERLEETSKILQLDSQEFEGLGFRIFDQEQFELLPATIATAFTYIAAATGDMSNVISYSEKALAQLPDTQQRNRGIVLMLLGIAHWKNGDLDTALETINNGIVQVLKDGNSLVLSNFQLMLVKLRTEMGQFSEALKIIHQVIARLDKGSGIPIALASFYLAMSELYYLKGELNKAQEFLDLSRAKARQIALPDYAYSSHMIEAQILAGYAKYQEALTKLEVAQNHYFASPVPERVSIAILEADIKLMMNARENLGSAVLEMLVTTEQEKIVLFKYLLKEGVESQDYTKLYKANELLDSLLERAILQKRERSTVDLLVYKSRIEWLIEHKKPAIEHLKMAMKMSLLEEYAQPFLQSQASLGEVYAELHRRKELPEFIVHLLTGSLISQNSLKKKSTLVETLSAREKEVLQLLSKGYTNQEICGMLFLALSTVKGYNRSIFDKLAVKHRTEAVIKAKELGIIN